MINWFNSKKWHFRNNEKRRNKKNKKHPSLVVGETKNEYANFGLTHSKMRGHHKNLELKKNPKKDDKKTAYLRDDLQLNKKSDMKEKLNNYKLSSKDKTQVEILIKKKMSTRR